MEPTFILADDAATRALGAALAGLLKAGDVIALHGDLGAGKTTLTRGLIQALCGADEDVPSPTYTLVQAYDGPGFPIWHFDLYRLDRPDEVRELGWDETQAGVALIEWPDRAGRYLPTPSWRVPGGAMPCARRSDRMLRRAAISGWCGQMPRRHC